MSNSEPDVRIQPYLERALEKVDAAVAFLAVTTDGHLVAGAYRKEISGKRLAAMGSSLMSLGNTITKELSMGRCRNVISENEAGVAVFLQIDPKTVLVSVASDTSALGMLLSVSRRCVQELMESMNNQNQETN